ncbi:MAG TPA: TolC family protein [Chitinophagaceae bacterium]|nr:TolC family protein [Chitinophagaceae bacterium]
MKKIRIISVVTIAITALLSNRVWAQQLQASTTHAFSIQQCIDYAHNHNVQVKNALIDYQIQEQTNRGITAAAYPQLSATAATNYYPKVPVQIFPNFISAATYAVLEQEGVKNGSGQPITSPGDFGFIAAAFGTKWNASGTVNLSQLLFDGQVFVGLQARKASLDYAAKSAEVTEENVKVNIYKIYYQLAVGKTQMQQIDANIALSNKLLHDTKAMYENGFQEKLDVDKATVQLANLQTLKLKTQNNLDNGYAGLKFLLGMPETDSLILIQEVTEDSIKNNILQPWDSSYADRKEYQVLQYANTLNRYNVKRYKYTYLPTAKLTSAYGEQAARNSFNFFSKGDWFPSWFIGLNINIPIFDGFEKAANLKKAQLQYQQSQNQLDYFKISISNDVVQAQTSFKSAIVTLDYQKKNMDLAQQVYDQTKLKYETGTGSNLEVTNAQADLVTAQTNYVSAMYDAVVARVDYLKAIGKLQ